MRSLAPLACSQGAGRGLPIVGPSVNKIEAPQGSASVQGTDSVQCPSVPCWPSDCTSGSGVTGDETARLRSALRVPANSR